MKLTIEQSRLFLLIQMVIYKT